MAKPKSPKAPSEPVFKPTVDSATPVVTVPVEENPESPIVNLVNPESETIDAAKREEVPPIPASVAEYPSTPSESFAPPLESEVLSEEEKAAKLESWLVDLQNEKTTFVWVVLALHTAGKQTGSKQHDFIENVPLGKMNQLLNAKAYALDKLPYGVSK